jgi:hypothetical protein
METKQLTDSEKIEIIGKRVKSIQRVQYIQGAVALLVAFGVMAVIVNKVKKAVK